MRRELTVSIQIKPIRIDFLTKFGFVRAIVKLLPLIQFATSL